MMIVLLAEVALALGGLVLSSNPIPGIIILPILLLPVEIIFLITGLLFMIIGGIRFARTGSIAEGWRFPAIRENIRKIGWGKYIIALILLLVIGIIFSIVTAIPAIIPYIGWVIPVILSPLLTVFTARYLTLVYETGEIQPAAPVTP